jgi:hypothetical protein
MARHFSASATGMTPPDAAYCADAMVQTGCASETSGEVRWRAQFARQS